MGQTRWTANRMQTQPEGPLSGLPPQGRKKRRAHHLFSGYGFRLLRSLTLMTAHLKFRKPLDPSLSSWRCLGDVRDHATTTGYQSNTDAVAERGQQVGATVRCSSANLQSTASLLQNVSDFS